MDPSLTVTALGDLFPASAVALLLFAWCWSYAGRATAAAFAICYLGAALATTLLKLLSREAFLRPDQTGLLHLSSGAPSGHATLATVVYGSALLMFLGAGRGGLAVAGVLVCLTALAAVFVTRVTLGTHTIADVAAGVAVSLGFVALFDLVRRRRAEGPTGGAGVLLAGMVTVAAVALASGVRVSSYAFL